MPGNDLWDAVARPLAVVASANESDIVIEPLDGGMYDLHIPEGWVDDLGEPLKVWRTYRTRGIERAEAWADQIRGWQKR